MPSGDVVYVYEARVPIIPFTYHTQTQSTESKMTSDMKGTTTETCTLYLDEIENGHIEGPLMNDSTAN